MNLKPICAFGECEYWSLDHITSYYVNAAYKANSHNRLMQTSSDSRLITVHHMQCWEAYSGNVINSYPIKNVISSVTISITLL